MYKTYSIGGDLVKPVGGICVNSPLAVSRRPHVRKGKDVHDFSQK